MGLTVGIDIGGTKIAGGVVDEAGNILSQERRSTPSRGAKAVVAATSELILEFKTNYAIEAVGVGCAGFVDETRSKVLTAPNLGWTNESLRPVIEAEVGLPVVIENDANAAAWGEFRFGAGIGHNHMVCVTVGTGVGGGLVFDGGLYRGSHGLAAEFGHMCVEVGGRLCGCGNRGCWEQYASGNALVREARMLAAERRSEAGVLLGLGDGTPEGVNGKDITQAAREGDVVALAAFDALARWLGMGMADVWALLDPGVFVIGGGVSEAGDLLLGATKRAFVEARTGKDKLPMPDIYLAKLGNDAGLVGAADLARH